jgi:hypothetical protein
MNKRMSERFVSEINSNQARKFLRETLNVAGNRSSKSRPLEGGSGFASDPVISRRVDLSRFRFYGCDPPAANDANVVKRSKGFDGQYARTA